MKHKPCFSHVLILLVLLLLFAPVSTLAQSLEERLLGDAYAAKEEKSNVLVYFEPLRAFGVDGTHYQFFTLTDEPECRASIAIYDGMKTDGIGELIKCEIRQVDQVFLARDLGLSAGLHDGATIFADPGIGVFFFRSSQMKNSVVLYNEPRSVLGPLDVLTAISVGLGADPDKMEIWLDEFSFHRQPWEKPISFAEFATWSVNQTTAYGIEDQTDYASNCENEPGLLSSCPSCSHGGAGASSCSCPGKGCSVPCHTGNACCRCGVVNPNEYFCCGGTGSGGGGSNWPPPFWPPFPPYPEDPY